MSLQTRVVWSPLAIERVQAIAEEIAGDWPGRDWATGLSSLSDHLSVEHTRVFILTVRHGRQDDLDAAVAANLEG